MRRRSQVEVEVESGDIVRRGPSPAGMVALGFIGGIALGLALWSRQMRHFRRGLFSASPLRRFAALGYLSGHPSLESTRVLSDYVAWERRPMLRRRGERALKRMKQTLEQ